LSETSLHTALKQWYSQPGDLLETSVDGSIIDIVRGDLLIEIQTRSFTALRHKLERLLVTHPVRLVYPVAAMKWIIRQDAATGKRISRRKSPRRGRAEDLFRELVYLAELASHPGLTVEVLLVHEEELRINDGAGSWRRKGWSIFDRRLIKVTGSFVFTRPEEYLTLLPTDMPRPFTAKELGQCLGMPAWLAYKMVYCLRKMGLIKPTGRRNRATLYAEINHP
jgi:hypothetical protein